MLQTWRLNSKSQNETHQRQVFDPETARPIVQQACNSCRIKKLRCSGEKTGCFRCQTLSQHCVYSQGSTRGSARSRKNKESASKADRHARRKSVSTNPSSAPAAPSPPTQAGPMSPCPGPFPPVSNGPSPELRIIPARPRSGPGDISPPDVDMMPFKPREYLPTQNVSYMQMTGLETYRSSDAWMLSWPDSTAEHQLAVAKAPWEGAALPLSLSSLGGWELRTQGYDDTPLTPTAGNPVSEPIISDIQTSPLSTPPQAGSSQHSTDDGYWLPAQALEPCQCLQRVVFLLEEIDAEAVNPSVKEIGSWLSRHKEALRCSEALLTCLLCQAKPEHMTILAFLTDRLIAMCEDVVAAYLSTLAGAAGHGHGLAGPKDGAWLVWVGNFEIDSPQEWSAVVSTMLVMQLRALDGLMAQFRDLLRSIGGEGVRRKADATQGRVSALLEKLSPPLRDQNGFAVPLPPCGPRSDADH
ncbi:hypothetical protein F4802DRAFT_506485 [Xylaria palmicola]|nr:hypothetical protein F4802DRAFT_506485 [Xylaria palmicola]